MAQQGQENEPIVFFPVDEEQKITNMFDSCRREHALRLRAVEKSISEFQEDRKVDKILMESVFAKVNKIEGMAKGLYYAIGGVGVLMGLIEKLS